MNEQSQQSTMAIGNRQILPEQDNERFVKHVALIISAWLSVVCGIAFLSTLFVP